MANPSILGGCNNVLDMVPPKYHLACDITTANSVGLKRSVTLPVQNCVGCESGRSLLTELSKPGLSDLLNSGTEDWSGNRSSWHAPMPTKVMANSRPHLVEVAPTCPPAETVDCSGRARMFLDTRTESSPEGNQCYWLPKSLLELRLDLVGKSVTELDIFFFYFIYFVQIFWFLSCHLTVIRFVTVGAQGCGWVWHF